MMVNPEVACTYVCLFDVFALMCVCVCVCVFMFPCVRACLAVCACVFVSGRESAERDFSPIIRKAKMQREREHFNAANYPPLLARHTCATGEGI